MIYLILLGVTFFIQLLASSWYTLVETNQGVGNAFKYKMLCSFIYIADILLCGAMAQAYGSIFYWLVFAGIGITFIGDILQSKLQKNKDRVYSIFRSISSLLFGIGISFQFINRFEIKSLINVSNLLILLGMLIVFVIYALRDKALKKTNILLLIPAFLFTYISVIAGIAFQKTNIPQMQTLSFLVITSAIFIFVSDIINSGKFKESKKLLRNNLYFFGLMFFACSVYNSVISGG